MGQQINIATGKQLVMPAILFFEDFQSPVVSGYDEGQLPDNGNWLLSDTGFGASRAGLNNADGGDWVASGADDQGFDCNYTNSGLGTAEGVIGTININTVTYKMTVTVAYDKAVSPHTGAASGDYDILLCSLAAGFDRQDWAAGASAWQAAAFIDINGSVADDGLVHTFSATYTTDPVTDAARSGQDLAIGIDGATSHAIHTSVKVEII